MSAPHELDGAKVIKQTKNDASQKIGVMFFEEKDGSTIEIGITGLAIVQYEEENGFYLFMCDHNWEVQDDYLLNTVEEAIEWAEKSFDVSEKDWN
ncbi:MAG: hypothetical protein ACE3JQ_01590 [Paenisporosarcina sp.]